MNIESVQNTNRYKSSSKGASFGLSTSLGGYSTGINITPDNLLNNALNNGDGLPVIGKSGVYGPGGSSWNLGINGSKGKGEFAWVQEQTGLVGENKVDVTVGENTDLKGGIIASKSKELTLDTGTLTFSDLADKDKSKNVGGSISVGGPLSGGGNESEGKIGGSGDLSVTVEGQYAKKDKEGVTRATVGEGEITIRDEAKQKELEESGQTQKMANLNRDLDKAQEVTKDEETEINLYVSDTSLEIVGKAGEALGKFLESIVPAQDDVNEFIEKIKSGEISQKELNQLKLDKRSCNEIPGCTIAVEFLGDEGATLREQLLNGSEEAFVYLVQRIQQDPEKFDELMHLLDMPNILIAYQSGYIEEYVKGQQVTAQLTEEAVKKLLPVLKAEAQKVALGERNGEFASLSSMILVAGVISNAPKGSRGKLVKELLEPVNDILSATRHGFYNPRTWRKNYDDFYNGNVTSTTVPPYSKPNVKLAGQRHPKTEVVFDQRGFPIFDDLAKFDTRFVGDAFRNADYQGQMRMATKDLKAAIERGEVLRSKFNTEQLKAINSGEAKIPKLTWHHHQDTGRMQLVPAYKHGRSGHIGGDAMSKGK